MRSSLASRNVCRRLLVVHDLPSPVSALSGLSHASSPRSARPRRAVAQPSPCRTFFNFLKVKPPRQVKNAGFEPGFETFLQFRANTVQQVKLPSDQDLLHAVRIFFNHKISERKAVNKTQALVARMVIEHLQLNRPGINRPSEREAVVARKTWLAQPVLTREDLAVALRALAIPHRQGPSEDVAELATVVYRELRALRMALEGSRGTEDRPAELFSDDLTRLLTILTHHTRTAQAAGILSQFTDLVPDLGNAAPEQKAVVKRLFELHLIILRGYGREADHYQLRLYAQKLCSAGFPYTPEWQGVMTRAFAAMGEDGEEELREWFERPLSGVVRRDKVETPKSPAPKTYLDLVSFSFRSGRQPEWVKKALQELCDQNPPKRWWDVIFIWAVYQGKDIARIRKMADVVAQVNPDDESVRVDIQTINGMLEAAITRKELFLAERINSLVSELGLWPDNETHTLLLQVRIAGKDKVGTASVFEDILYTGPELSSAKKTAAVNAYVRFACSTSDSASVMDALSRIEARHVELEPETVVDVCLKFLRDDKTMEVIDTLGIHLSPFSVDERRLVRAEMMQYCLDMTISTARAWDTYSILRQLWPETTREERAKLMQAFFSRKRPDMACHIFGHMRAHPDETIRPDLDTYVLCLENLGAFPDPDSLALIHNMFKMDAIIQPSTRLYNAFMIAYTGCNEPRKALEFWRQVANSKDGPTYKSLELVFRACQKLPSGLDVAKSIWDKMQSLDVDVPAFVYDAFNLMVAGQGGLGKTKSMLVARMGDYSEEPPQTLLAQIFNALPYPDLQNAYEQWASLEFPEKWQKIQKLKRVPTVEATERVLIPPERIKAD